MPLAVATAVAEARALRVKLAEAGVEGSPPPGHQATIPALLQRAQEADAEARRLGEERDETLARYRALELLTETMVQSMLADARAAGGAGR